MTLVYIIFILICILLTLSIIFGIILYKQIKERLNSYDDDFTEFIEFYDVLLNKSVIECIVKNDKNISIITNTNSNYVEKFDSKEECDNRYSDILDCISYYPKS